VKVAFIADFFNSDLLGGAELNDSVLLSHLEKEFQVTCISSKDIIIEELSRFDYLVISNFCMLDEESKSFIQNNSKYIIYEHDHKYVSTRDPSRFPNFEIPEKHILNREFYKKAYKVICLGQKQVEIIHKNLKINNLESISGSLWSTAKLDFIKKLNNNKVKNNKFAIVDSSNPIKNTKMAIEFCKGKNIEYDLIKSPDPYEFIETLSRYNGLVFFPGVLESMCRLAVEAKMVNCKLITIPKMLGAFYEPWFNLNGKELISRVENNVKLALDRFSQIISQCPNEPQ
jgi:hypothetical protein